MSSVLVKGIKIPSECRKCPFIAYYKGSGNTWCNATSILLARDYQTIKFDGRHPDCPLVEIPPHGRLIDADEFSRRMYSVAFVEDTDMQKWDSGCWIRYKLFEQVLREQPTIEPERKTGKWNFIGDNMFECTCCGIAYTAQQFGSLKNHANDKRFPRFCPNCGAKMEVDT